MTEEELKPIVGVTFTVSHTGLFKDGYWEVISSIVEKRTTDGETWESKEIKALGINDAFDDAYNTSMQSVVEQFNDVINKNGIRSLFPDKVSVNTQVA